MAIKKYKAKVTTSGNSMAILVPAWIKKAFDVNKGDEVVVKLEKVSPSSDTISDL